MKKFTDRNDDIKLRRLRQYIDFTLEMEVSKLSCETTYEHHYVNQINELCTLQKETGVTE